jgi:uncharacterized repeat protein (TIGR01451 family)
MHIPRNLAFACFLTLIAVLLVIVPLPTSRSQQKEPAMEKNSPPDTTPYARPAIPEDYAPGGHPALPQLELPTPIFPTAFVRDLVVSNTNPNLTNTDIANDGEPSIAINPSNTNEIVITAFSGNDGANTPLWHTTDGENTWSKQFTIPAAPGVPTFLFPNCGGVCDQSVDYGRNNQISGTFLSGAGDVHSGTTTNPASAAAWNWLVIGGVTQRTNNLVPSSFGNTDQPWLLVNLDPTTATQDNVYVAYDNFSGGPDMRVAVSLGVDPPNFVRDNLSGTAGGGFVNPGHRLAVDPNNGAVYSLWQVRNGAGDDGTHNISYRLNRSIDGGQNWTLNGMAGGITVATADSTQACPAPTGCGPGCTNNTFKFGTVNALLGGVLHAAVDPTNSDVYYVYGNRDSATNNNRLAIRRLTSNGMGGLNVGAEVFVTGQVQAALPSVAVASDGTVGVLYTQFDGLSPMSNIPMFSVHFAMSIDQGQTFPTDLVLENFLSSSPDTGACRQRVLGDYQQVKAVGTTFYGVFTGNGVPFGRPFSNHDPIFFRVCVGAADLAITKTDSPDPVITGNNLTYTVTVTNNGPDTATSVIVTDDLPAETTFVSCSSTGGGVCGGSANNRTVTFASLTSGESETITFVATVNCSVADGTVISNTATVSSCTNDPNTNNNSATATTTASNPPPVITGASVDKPVLWPPNHKLENVTVNYQVTDNCPLPPNSCTLSVTSNEPINGKGDGNTSPDWIILDAHHVQLRAERAGNGNGRIYTITITCIDSGGNSSSQSVSVNVPHDQGKKHVKPKKSKLEARSWLKRLHQVIHPKEAESTK